MSEKINPETLEGTDLDRLATLYGNKFAAQKLFVDSGLTSVETRLLTPEVTDIEVKKAVREVFEFGSGATVRFSYRKELNLPRGFFIDPEECLTFIRSERRNYALIVQEYTQLKDSFELYIDDTESIYK